MLKVEDLGCNICFISYSEFIFGSVRGKKGDFVLVSNADAVDPDTPEGCDVAQIIELYETGKVNYAVHSVDYFLACLQFCFLGFHLSGFVVESLETFFSHWTLVGLVRIVQYVDVFCLHVI